MKITLETIKRVVTIVVNAQKCEKGQYVITPTLIYTKEKSLALGWLRGYVEIEWTTKKL